MLQTKIYQVFSDQQNGLHGNTSAVILTSKPLTEQQMQQIAADLCQPATTFLFPKDTSNNYDVRWYAPDAEIDLCGHGTMAAVAYLSDEQNSEKSYRLHAQAGVVTGKRDENGSATINLAAIPVTKSLDIPSYLERGLGVKVKEYLETANKNIVVLDTAEMVKTLNPDFSILRESNTFGYVVTAPGKEVDFVSRTFVPHVQQLEDPATGSSHAVLTSYWSEKLGKASLQALQLSKRGGKFICTIANNQVSLSGEYNCLLKGSLMI